MANSATTTKPEVQETQTKPVPARFAANKGRVAIIWNPDQDSKVPRPPVGTKSPRPFVFEWVDQSELEKKRKEREEMDILKSQMVSPLPLKTIGFRFEPGLNWVESQKWEAAIVESARRLEAEDYCADEDQLQQLMRDGAIRKLATRSENITGTIVDYNLAEARQIIDAVNDLGTLMDFQALSSDTGLSKAILDRIERLQGRF
jgi:hypothetical protein